MGCRILKTAVKHKAGKGRCLSPPSCNINCRCLIPVKVRHINILYIVTVFPLSNLLNWSTVFRVNTYVQIKRICHCPPCQQNNGQLCHLCAGNKEMTRIDRKVLGGNRSSSIFVMTFKRCGFNASCVAVSLIK